MKHTMLCMKMKRIVPHKNFPKGSLTYKPPNLAPRVIQEFNSKKKTRILPS